MDALSSIFDLLRNLSPEEFKSIALENPALALTLCFGSGIITSFTPCVYPMIPITINIFGRASLGSQSHRAFNIKTFGLAAVYVAGMSTLYSLLGVIAGKTGSLFGNILQSGWFLGGLTLLFILLGLAQLGVFKLQLPSAWQTKLSRLGHERNLVGIFFMGFFGGLIVSPCVGPVVAGILAFIFETGDAFLGFIYFLSFSLGLGILFLVIGGFSGSLSKLPRSGDWMTRVNRLLAGLLFIAALYFGVLWMKNVGILSRSIPTSNTQEQGIQWMNAESEALALAKEKQFPVILDFTAEWCVACHEIEDQIFGDPRVIEKMKRVIALRIDVTEDSPENSEILQKYGVFGLPAVLFIDRSGTQLKDLKISGLVPTDTFLESLDKLLTH